MELGRGGGKRLTKGVTPVSFDPRLSTAGVTRWSRSPSPAAAGRGRGRGPLSYAPLVCLVWRMKNQFGI